MNTAELKLKNLKPFFSEDKMSIEPKNFSEESIKKMRLKLEKVREILDAEKCNK